MYITLFLFQPFCTLPNSELSERKVLMPFPVFRSFRGSTRYLQDAVPVPQHSIWSEDRSSSQPPHHSGHAPSSRNNLYSSQQPHVQLPLNRLFPVHVPVFIWWTPTYPLRFRAQSSFPTVFLTPHSRIILVYFLFTSLAPCV